LKARLLWTVCILFSIWVMQRLSHGQMASPSLQVSPTHLDFGTQVVGSESRPEVITVSNPRSLTITLAEVIASGIDFPEKSDCGKDLAPGAHCTIQVSFKPAISGQRIGSVDITASDSGSPHFVALVGTGE
jgi:HYDIN/CFA65/VesB family protein